MSFKFQHGNRHSDSGIFPNVRGGLDQDDLEDPDTFFASAINNVQLKRLSEVTSAIRQRHLSESSSLYQHLHSRQSLVKQCIRLERNKCRSQYDEYNSTVVKVYSRLHCFDENEPVDEIDLSSVSTNTDTVLHADDIQQEEQGVSPVGGESEIEQQDDFLNNITDENHLPVPYHEDVSSISEDSSRGKVETKEIGPAKQQSEATTERRLIMVTTDSTRHHDQSEVLINAPETIPDTTKKLENCPERQLAISHDNELTGLQLDVSCNASYSHTPLKTEISPGPITKKESISSSSPSVSRPIKSRQNKHSDLSERINRKKNRREKVSRNSIGGLSCSSKQKCKKGKVQPNRFATVFASQGIPQPRTFTVTPVVELETNTSTNASNKNLRRSNRVRIKPLEYWKGDCVEYGPNDFGEGYTGVTNMSIPLYIRKANPTPFKPRKPRPNLSPNVSKAIGITKNRTMDSEPKLLTEQFDATKLRKKFEYIDGNAASIWNDANAESMEMKVICRSKSMKYKDLPKLKVRTKTEGSTSGKAAQAFYVSYDCNPVYPGYIMGKLVLPPKGMKDAECVGSCAQTFTILSGQPNSIEVAFADPNESVSKSNLRNAQRFLLDPGDVFRIPPGNSYQLQNHSKAHECTMSWTIIRPTHPEDMEDA